MNSIPPLPGTYALLLRADNEHLVQAGKHRLFSLRPGWYLYTGSAMGPGGMRARVRHHLNIHPKPHWHLDWLRPHLRAEGVLWEAGPTRLECRWAAGLAKEPTVTIPQTGFGASDCTSGCAAHLLFFGTMGALSGWRNFIEEVVERLSDPGTDRGWCDFSGSADQKYGP